MTDLRTDESLLARLKRATSRNPSRAQVERQRISFIMGSLPEESDMTREQIQDVLEQQEGKKQG
ncbi:hypothetical protein [Microvirga zambiensis]|uniref:hypothetical protein n=1 Tax=Microvirga zambiensis TaxID=1402137 RepID=UPI00191F7E7D|nr:hypothetical protein [Microvirga zambiensis]